jgi:cytochrome P450
MRTCTSDMLARWAAESAWRTTAFDLHREMMRLTLRIVGRTLFSVDLDGEARTIGDALSIALTWANDYVESAIRVPPWVPTPKNVRFNRAKKTIDEIAYRLIRDRRAGVTEGDDLLGMLMAAEDEANGEKMTDEQLKDELLTLVLAGHETTANALSFLFFLLSTHPDVERALAAEIARVVGDGDVELAHLPRLTYTRAVIEEAMRLFPPAWVIERQAVADDVVLGYRIPRGVIVGIFPYLLHRHPSHWMNPEGFDPARFAPEAAESRPKHVYLPFGGGPRFCIGHAFAMMEMQILLATIVRRHRLQLSPGFRLALDPSVTLRPDAGVWMTLADQR